jgi:porphobilinogen deaminase
MGKLDSRLGALEATEYEAMILSDVEKMHNNYDALEGILMRFG